MAIEQPPATPENRFSGKLWFLGKVFGGPRENWRYDVGGECPFLASVRQKIDFNKKWHEALMQSAAILNPAVILASH
jgi:hypothetical protein